MLTRFTPMKRSGFNRRAAAAAKLKNSALVEPYALIERFQQYARGRAHVAFPPNIKGRFCVYRVCVVHHDYGRRTSVRLEAPDGREVSAWLDGPGTGVRPC